MSGSGVQGRKRKRSESEDPEAPHSRRSSPYSQVLSLDQEPSFAEYLPALPATPTADPIRSPSTSLIPLTEKNLRLLDPTMPPKTPVKSEYSVGATASVQATRKQLADWNHLIEDSKTRARYSKFLEAATATITPDRLSAMSASSVQNIQETYDMVKDSNEATFTADFWNELIKKTRLVKSDGNEDDPTPVSRRWVSDEIIAARDGLFIANCLVAVTKCTPLEQSLRNRTPDIALPKPDLLYGIKLIENNANTTFSRDQIAVIKQFSRLTMASPGLVMPWFIVEVKTLDGTIDEAVTQAARCGAVLCASFRRLDTIAGTVHLDNGADPRSHVFSLALSPTAARMSVHYAEVQSREVVAYHMHHLRTYDVWDPSHWQTMRKDVNNAIEWGVLQARKDMVNGIITKLVEMGDKAISVAEQLEAAENEPRQSKKQKLSHSGGGGTSSSGK